MFARTDRKSAGMTQETNPCFAWMVGMLLWGMRNAHPPVAHPPVDPQRLN